MTEQRRNAVLRQLGKIESLPTLPDVMSKLSSALENPNCSAAMVVDVLSNDPSISTQILKTVNSPIFSGGGGRTKDLKSAITRLGFKEVKNIALSTSVFKMFEGVKSALFDRKGFWEHCLCSSLAAIELASVSGFKRVPRDELHLAGLLHDVGKIILDAYFPELFEKSLTLSFHQKVPLFEAERLTMGIDHGELGAIVADRWKLPPMAIDAIRHHHDPSSAPDEHRRIIDLVHMANYVANSQELGTSGDFATPVFKREIWESLDLSPEAMKTVVDSVVAQEGELLQGMWGDASS